MRVVVTLKILRFSGIYELEPNNSNYNVGFVNYCSVLVIVQDNYFEFGSSPDHGLSCMKDH